MRLIPAQFVRPFVKSNKNDYCDAEAIAEAVERENMRFVPIKTEDQLDLQALHRVRERLVSRRTSVINQIRAFLLERGISFRKGPASLRRQMPEILENADERLTARMRRLLDFLWQEWKHLQLQIESLMEIWRRSRTATRLAFGCSRFQESGRWWPQPWYRLSATGLPFTRDDSLPPGSGWYRGNGLPEEAETARHQQARKPVPPKMFIHGARAAVLRVKREGSCLGQWMSGLETRAARNVVIVATANKLARISWAVLSSGNDYRPMHRALR